MEEKRSENGIQERSWDRIQNKSMKRTEEGAEEEADTADDVPKMMQRK